MVRSLQLSLSLKKGQGCKESEGSRRTKEKDNASKRTGKCRLEGKGNLSTLPFIMGLRRQCGKGWLLDKECKQLRHRVTLKL